MQFVINPKKREENQQKHLEVTVLQTGKFQAMEEKLEQELANITTRDGGSIPKQIPATVNTGTSSRGGSNTSCSIYKELPTRNMY